MSALIWAPFPDRESARTVAETLLAEKLVRCANLMDPVHSLFIWEGASDSAEECGALFKTTATLLDRAVERLAALHPYDTPAVMGWRCDAVAPATGAWLGELEDDSRC